MFEPKFIRSDPLNRFGSIHLQCDIFGGEGMSRLSRYPTSLTLGTAALRITLQNKSIGPMTTMCLYNDFKPYLLKPAGAPGLDPTFITYVGM